MGYVEMVIAMLIYGSIGVVSRQIDMTSGPMSMVRTIGGSVLIFLILLLKREKFDKELLKRNFLKLMFGGLAMGLSWLFLFEAYQRTAVSIATLLYYMAPIFTIILAPIVLKERFVPVKFVGVMMALVGMVLINGTEIGGPDPRGGVIFGLLSAVFYTTMILINKTVEEGFSGLQITFIQLVFAAIIVSFFTIFITKETFQLPQTLEGNLYLIVLVVVHTVLACILYFSGVHKLPAQTVALTSFIDPFSALIFSYIFLGETLGLVQVLGVVLILGGALFGELMGFKSRDLNSTTM